MADYYFSRFGNDTSNTGTAPGSAWRSINKFNTTTFAAGDNIYFAEGSTFTGQMSINDNGTALNPIRIRSYKDGSGVTAMPIISNPDSIASNPRCLELLGDYIYVEGLDFRDAEEAGVEIFQTNDNNRIEKCRFDNCGVGVRCKGNNNLIKGCFAFNLKMSSNLGNSSDVGGIFVSLEKNGVNTNDGNTIEYCVAINAKALSVQFNNDGGFIEIFRGCTNWTVRHNYMKNCKGFMEVGGDNTPGDTISGGLVYNNVVVDCYGIICYLNTKGGSFSVDIVDAGIKIYNNDFYMSDRSTSAIFPAGNWTGTPIDYRNNRWKGITTFIATDGTTNLNTILTHTHNRYQRFDGGSSLGTGFVLGTGETIGSWGMIDEAARDFHITTTAPGVYASGTPLAAVTTDMDGTARPNPPSIGAFEPLPVIETPVAQAAIVTMPLAAMDNQNSYPVTIANRVKGGNWVLTNYSEMIAIPAAMRAAGMTVWLLDIQMLFRLDSDLYSWHPVEQFNPFFRPRYSAFITDTKASGTAGGGDTATITAYNQRALNTVNYDDGIDCGLSSGSVVLRKPGTYLLSAMCVANRTNRSRVRIFDVTKNRVAALSPTSFATSGSTTNTQVRIVDQLYVIDQQTTLRLDMYLQVLATVPTETYGFASSTGDSEVYASMRIELAR